MIFLLIAFCILMESTFIAYPLTLIVVVFINIAKRENSDLAVFFSGLLLDVFALRPMGVSSLFFLTLILIGGIYRQKIHEGTFIYRFGYLFIAFLFYNLLFYKSLNAVNIAVTIILGSLLLLRFERVLGPKDKRRLSV